MATSSSSRRSSGPVLPIKSAFQGASSPSGGMTSPSMYDSPFASSFASSTNSSFYCPSSDMYRRSTSPPRVNLHGMAPQPSSSIRFSIDRSRSPSRSMAASPRDHVVRKQIKNPLPAFAKNKKTCMCSPTTHPGSFRCSLHKNCNSGHSSSYSPNRLNARRSAMANSLVRIGTVEGDWVKRALTALIRPSSHQQKRRGGYHPRPSRLSIMSKADDNL